MPHRNKTCHESNNQHTSEYWCPCGYRYNAYGGNRGKNIQMVIRLHKKVCEKASKGNVPTTFQNIEMIGGNVVVASSHE